MSSQIDLSVIEARANKATPGPWVSPTPEQIRDDKEHLYFHHTHDAVLMPITEVEDAWYKDPNHSFYYVGAAMNHNANNYVNDSVFIAHAREDIPALIAAVRERDARIIEMEKELIYYRERRGYVFVES